MPKLQKKAITVNNVTHPRSRKAIKMFKENKKKQSREQSKTATYVKQNMTAERMMWFKDQLPSDGTVCSKEFTNDAILRYLKRFDEEMEQIRMKHSIGHRKNRQHASREDVIRFTQERELLEYNTCGIEIPNLLDSEQVKRLREWNGELRYLPNFKLCRLGKKHLTANSETEETLSPSDDTSSSSPVVENEDTSKSKEGMELE